MVRSHPKNTEMHSPVDKATQAGAYSNTNSHTGHNFTTSTHAQPGALSCTQGLFLPFHPPQNP